MSNMVKVFDMHCDTIGCLYESSQDECLKDNNLNIDISKLTKGQYLAQCFAMFVPYTVDNPLGTCLDMIDRFYLELNANQETIALAKNVNDIERNAREGKLSAILTVEEGGVVKGCLSNLRNLYRLGVRMITLTWNYENEIGFPNYNRTLNTDCYIANTKDGLTSFGIEMVQEMNRLGMIIDVSHLSDAGFYDVLKYTQGPFVASHSNARSLCPHCRNMSDDMIEQLALRGGVIGINYCADFLRNPQGNDNFSYVSDIVKHIQHIARIGGIDCVGLGSDFDGITQNLEMKDASYLPMLEVALKDAGFNEEDIKKIFYKNVLTVFKKVLG